MVRTRDLATGGIVAALALLSAVYASELPAELAVHFDSAGEPNNYMQAETFLAGNVLLAGGLAVLFAVLPRIDPLGENFDEFQTAYDGFAVVTVAFVGYIHGLVIAYNLGYEFGMIQATVPAVAALYLLLGPLMWRAEQNWFVGVRTPWTLSDERVWNRTHRRTAPLFVVAGILTLGGLFVPEYAALLMSVPILVVSLGAVLYSFVIYQRVDPA
jgi:uncharacterized membrane protein